MTSPSERTGVFASMRHVASTNGDGWMSSAEGRVLEPAEHQCMREGKLFFADEEITGLTVVNDVGGGCPNQEGLLGQESLVPRNTTESTGEQGSLCRLSNFSEREPCSPSFFVYPVDSDHVHQEAVSMCCDCHFPVLPCVEQLVPICTTTPCRANNERVPGAAASTGQDGLGLPRMYPTLSPKPCTSQVINEAGNNTPTFSRGCFSPWNAGSLLLEAEVDNSFRLPPSAVGNVEEVKEESIVSSPALRRETALDLRTPRLYNILQSPNLFFSGYSSTQNSLFFTCDASEGSNEDIFDRVSSFTCAANNNVTDWHVNLPIATFEEQGDSETVPFLGSPQELVDAPGEVVSSRVYSPTQILLSGIGSTNTSDDQHTLEPRRYSGSDAVDEGLLFLYSRDVCMPPFTKPADVTPLLERADRNLQNAVTLLVPILSSAVLEGGEDVFLGSSRDTCTLGSLSWFNSTTNSERLVERFCRVVPGNHDQRAEPLEFPTLPTRRKTGLTGVPNAEEVRSATASPHSPQIQQEEDI